MHTIAAKQPWDWESRLTQHSRCKRRGLVACQRDTPWLQDLTHWVCSRAKTTIWGRFSLRSIDMLVFVRPWSGYSLWSVPFSTCSWCSLSIRINLSSIVLSRSSSGWKSILWWVLYTLSELSQSCCCGLTIKTRSCRRLKWNSSLEDGYSLRRLRGLSTETSSSTTPSGESNATKIYRRAKSWHPQVCLSPVSSCCAMVTFWWWVCVAVAAFTSHSFQVSQHGTRWRKMLYKQQVKSKSKASLKISFRRPRHLLLRCLSWALLKIWSPWRRSCRRGIQSMLNQTLTSVAFAMSHLGPKTMWFIAWRTMSSMSTALMTIWELEIHWFLELKQMR